MKMTIRVTMLTLLILTNICLAIANGVMIWKNRSVRLEMEHTTASLQELVRFYQNACQVDTKANVYRADLQVD